MKGQQEGPCWTDYFNLSDIQVKDAEQETKLHIQGLERFLSFRNVPGVRKVLNTRGKGEMSLRQRGEKMLKDKALGTTNILASGYISSASKGK